MRGAGFRFVGISVIKVCWCACCCVFFGVGGEGVWLAVVASVAWSPSLFQGLGFRFVAGMLFVVCVFLLVFWISRRGGGVGVAEFRGVLLLQTSP